MAAAETWEQIEWEMKDLRTRRVTLSNMLACDRVASSRAGNTWVPESHVTGSAAGNRPCGSVRSFWQPPEQGQWLLCQVWSWRFCFHCINPFNDFMNPLQWRWLLYTFHRWDGEGNSSPLQYPRLENPMDRGAWRATVHGVTKSRLCLSTQMNELRLGEVKWGSLTKVTKLRSGRVGWGGG